MRNNILIIAFLFCLISFASGQQLEEEVEVQLVQVDLIATDSKGALVNDLTVDDFIVKEDGKVQPITHFYNAASEDNRYPLTMSFLVDTSGSMEEKVAGLTRIQVAINAGELVIAQLRSDDQIELIEFNDKPEAIVPFTTDSDIVEEKLDALASKKANTAVRDSLVYALDRLRGKPGRKILLVLSDGMDSASKKAEEDVVEAIRKSDATLIAFYSEFSRLNFPGNTGDFSGNPNPAYRVKIRAGEDTLREWTEISGGQFYSFRREPELLQALEGLRAFLKGQYTLAYKPVAGKKKSEWRKLKVECKRKGIELRHRDGYWAGNT